MKQYNQARILLLVVFYFTSAYSAYPYLGVEQEELLRALLQNYYNSRQQSSLSSGLQIISITKARIQGTYRDPETGKGIHFMSAANDNGGGYMAITTLQGEPIIVAEQSYSAGAKLMSVEGEHFLITKDYQSSSIQDGRSKMASEFVVQNAHLQAVQVAIQDHTGAHISSILKHLDSTTANAKRERALRNLIGQTEIQLVINAAKALGESGINGKENHAARSFYAYVMRLQGAQMKEGISVQKHSDVSLESKFAWSESGLYCPAAEQNCPRGKCPQKQGGCRGMCGPSCLWCWSLVCGDCCYHQGCAEHDDCCENHGYFSWACLGVPFGFKCEGPYNCS